jgi:hypothetical protein
VRLVFSSPSSPEVGLLKSLLDEAGIGCEIRNQSMSSVLPFPEFQAELWVTSDDDYVRACQIRDLSRHDVPVERSASVRAAESVWNNVFLRVWVGGVCLIAAFLLTWESAAGKGVPPAIIAILLGVPGALLLRSTIRKRK